METLWSTWACQLDLSSQSVDFDYSCCECWTNKK
ncbi:unnamed protein product [Musa acuminata subsp. malaccensis]|uniref:(wild Malaysian banana) hypothetical protein n=1 Tax=Musa acuminata subsp. malaccensis TaxID=214687 RepID=A0A8D7AAN3_MUSAM|nr:unnamed protein product [Musa acuminata subsp. malaccensis]